jgi:hypothetical protein
MLFCFLKEILSLLLRHFFQDSFRNSQYFLDIIRGMGCCDSTMRITALSPKDAISYYLNLAPKREHRPPVANRFFESFPAPCTKFTFNQTAEELFS